MLRPLTFLLPLLLAITSYAAAQSTRADAERYSLVAVSPSTAAQRAALVSMDIDHIAAAADGLRCVLSTSELADLRSLGVPFHIVIDDVERYYADRSRRDYERLQRSNPSLLSHPSSEVRNFQLGTVGGFLTILQLTTQLRKMSELYPALASAPDSIGRTQQGRPILAIRISAKPADAGLPQVLITAMHHAREPAGTMSVLYTMWALLEGYGTDPEVTWLLDHRVVYFVPLVNPDGWNYNVQRSPEGGSMWRRNMRADGDSAVDLNRNYGPIEYWNHPIGGSSTNRNVDTYRGPAPFSEPETQAMRDFCLAHGFSVALNHHTYSNLFIRSQAIPPMTAADSAYFHVVTPALARTSGYAPGGDQIAVGYPARGNSDDWMFSFGRGPSGGHTFAWTPESGNEEDGFWPVPSRILPIAQWDHRMNLSIIWAAGAAPAITQSIWASSPTGPVAKITVTNLGREAMAEQASLSLGEVDAQSVPVLQPAESIVFDIPIPAHYLASTAPRPRLPVGLRYQTAVLHDTVAPLVHPETVLLEDDFEEGLSKWSKVSWGTEDVLSRGRVASDSPDALYSIDTVANELTLREPVSLVGYDGAELQFDASAAVEGRSHDARIEARQAGTIEWWPVNSPDLMIPVTHITEFRNHFRGDNRAWRRYSIALDQFLGMSVDLRFVIETPPSQNDYVFDGLKIDNIRLVATEPQIGSASSDAPASMELSAWPNPFADHLSIRLPGAPRHVSLTLYNGLGSAVRRTSSAAIDTRGLPSGRYTIVAIADGMVLRKGVVLER